MNIYQPNQSALTNAFKSQATLTEQKIIFLEQSLNKAQRDLNDVRFQQNHLKSKREDLIQNYHKTNRKLLKQVDELQQLINNNQQYIRLDQLITAFKNNNWNDHIARYLHENNKLTSQKIKIIQKIILTDQQLNDWREQINMIQEDINGLHDQNSALIIEFEELDEVIHQWNGSAIEPISKIYQIKKQLNELRASYLDLSSERQRKESNLNELKSQVDSIQENLNQLRKEQIPIFQEIDFQLKQSIQFWFSPDLVYKIFLDIFNDYVDFNKDKIDEVFSILMQIHDKIVGCCFSLLQKHIKFEERQQLFDMNFQDAINLINQYQQWFKEIDVQDFECLLVQKINNHQFMSIIEQKSQRFQAVLQKQIRIFSCTQEHTSLKAQQIELERQVHKLLYEQSMIQCNYQRLESQLQQLKIAGPILIMNTQSYQLEQILDRINTIEIIQKKNKQQIELNYPQQISVIESQIIQYQNQFQQLIEQLLTIKSDIKLVYNQDVDQDEAFLQMELQQLNQELHTQELLFSKSKNECEIKLQQFDYEENAILNRIETISQAMNDYRNQKPIKENIPPTDLHSKRQSLDNSIFDNNNKSNLKYSCHENTTDRSHSRSRSALGANSSSNSLRNFLNFQSPSQLKRTKLTLIHNHSNRNSQKQSINSSVQKIDDITLLSPNKSFISNKNQQIQSIKTFKVYKRTVQNTLIQKLQEVNNYVPKFVKYNEKMKCIEFYNANRIGSDLGVKDSALNIKQIVGITQQLVKGVIKQNFTFYGLFLLLQKNQKVEILFAKQEELIQFLNILK
ncbi:unnamed protein product [Paramecium primaurelia]|uniref:Uncharacterized protein n=1 Tax=Paramecium primaurelia TaxID=5886 RepID=A0A8S1KKS0_PARPR|nr:unnamed protein product [Paramecium primaurelia]